MKTVNPIFWKFRIKLLKTKHTHTANNILLLGDSNLRFWKSINEVAPNSNFINKSINGIKTNACLYYFNQLTENIEKVKTVILCIGENDLNELFPLEVKKVCENTTQILMKISERYSSANIIVFSLKCSPLRKSNWQSFYRVNQHNSKIAETNSNIKYLELDNCLRNTDGSINSSFFKIDQLHLNKKGYQKWAEILTKEFNNK